MNWPLFWVSFIVMITMVLGFAANPIILMVPIVVLIVYGITRSKRKPAQQIPMNKRIYFDPNEESGPLKARKAGEPGSPF